MDRAAAKALFNKEKKAEEESNARDQAWLKLKYKSDDALEKVDLENINLKNAIKDKAIAVRRVSEVQ